MSPQPEAWEVFARQEAAIPIRHIGRVDATTRDDAVVFVAESNGRIVGAASFWVRPRLNWTNPEAWIPDLIVSSPHRQRGTARRLLDACAAEARARGCHVLRLESGPERAAAHWLYEAYGFRHFARAYELRL